MTNDFGAAVATARERFRVWIVLAAFLVLAGCGGGGGQGPDSAAVAPVVTPPVEVAPVLPSSGTAFALSGSTEHPVARGRVLSYTQANAVLSATASEQLITFDVIGDQRLRVSFSLLAPASQLQPGVYRNLAGLTAAGTAPGFFSVEALDTVAGCTNSSSDVTVESVAFSAARLLELTLSFEHRCNNQGSSVSRGRLRWQGHDATRAPGPQAVPATLWQPPAGVLPVEGNYVYLESQTGDPIGVGRSYVLTQADNWIRVQAAGPSLKFTVQGDDRWGGVFHAMDSLSRLETGYYDGLLSEERRNPRTGAVSWVADIRNCQGQPRGWMAVDQVSYRGDVLAEIVLRFEQRCAGGSAAPLRGKIRWSADDTSGPAGPQAVPSNLWKPSAARLPGAGNYVYLEADADEWVSQGQTRLITPDQLPFSLVDRNGRLTVALGHSVATGWTGRFQGNFTQRRLERGLYAGLVPTAGGNPARGGFSWSGLGRACDGAGWFAVDEVSYTRGVLRSIDLRFEQVCAGRSQALRGKIHWVTSDPLVLAENLIDGPSLVQAPASLEPPVDGRSYVLLESGADDFIGQGQRYLYTLADAQLSVGVDASRLQFSVRGAENWEGSFTVRGSNPGEPGRPPLAPGTYTMPSGGLVPEPGPFLNVVGQGRGCDRRHGSYTVERIAVSGAALQVLDLTFEQYCDGAYLPLRGRVHWEASDSTAPAGPVFPAPVGLWRLPEVLVPASENYLYIFSPDGEFVGRGESRLLKAPEAEFKLFGDPGGPLDFRIHLPSGDHMWQLVFEAPYNAKRLSPGHYPRVTRALVGNPARGRMDIEGGSRGCSETDGFFVVDAVAYDGDQLTALDLRFEQFCEREGPPLRGQLRWRR